LDCRGNRHEFVLPRPSAGSVFGGSLADVQAKMPAEMKRWADVIVKGNIKPS